jgi:hypothetical protein
MWLRFLIERVGDVTSTANSRPALIFSDSVSERIGRNEGGAA